MIHPESKSVRNINKSAQQYIQQSKSVRYVSLYVRKTEQVTKRHSQASQLKQISPAIGKNKSVKLVIKCHQNVTRKQSL